MLLPDLCFLRMLYDIFVNSVRTPGGKLVYQYLKKPKKIPRCGQCKDKLRGIQPARPMERSRMCRRKKTVKRAYGGVLCHKCVKER
jgi:large subunit ribosomal protein L34e